MFEARRLGPGQSPESLAAASGTSIEPPGSVPAGPGGRSGASRASGLTALLWALRAGPALMLAAIVAAASLSTPLFMTTGNIGNVLDASAVIAVLAIGQLFVILTRGIDLSVGSHARAGDGDRGARLPARPRSGCLVIVAMLATGAAAGPSTAWSSSRAACRTRSSSRSRRSASRAASRCCSRTAARSRACRAIVTTIGGESIGWLPVLGVRRRGAGRGRRGARSRKLVWGRWIYAVGGNPEAARRTGIPVRRGADLRVRAQRPAAGVAAVITAGPHERRVAQLRQLWPSSTRSPP